MALAQTGRIRTWSLVTAAVFAVALIPSAHADDAPAAALAASSGIDFTGFVDAYAGYNFNKPITGTSGLRVFDAEHNAFTVALAEIAFEKKPVAGSVVGFRTDLDFGPAADISNSLEPGDKTILKNVQQAYVSWLASPKVQLDFGKFVTYIGAEVVESKDDWNYTRSFQFGWAIPIYHAGARATITASDKVTLAAYLVNGWNNVKENNTDKSFGGQIIAKPSGKLTLMGNVLAGKEGSSDDTRFLADAIVTINASSKVTVMANYDYAKEGDAKWQALSGYLKLQASDTVALSPRVEWLDDKDGFMTGTQQTLMTYTLTGEVKIGGGLLARVDARVDHSDKDYFASDTDGVFKKNQPSVTFGLVYAFGGKIS